jgi:hypothetical protein
MVRLQSFAKTYFTSTPKQCGEFIKRDDELMRIKDESHKFGFNLGFIVGLITGSCITAVLFLIFK